MLVKVLSFGTNWWARFGSEADGPNRFTRHAAYYNSTGVRCGGKVRRHWIVPGLIRFNGAGDFNPRSPRRSLGHTFLCSNLDFLFGGNRLLLKTKAHKLAVPDWFLVVVSNELHGTIDFAQCDWKSPQSKVIAASRLREAQEAMLLMKAGDWIRTGWGFWQLSVPAKDGSHATLELRGDDFAA
ncbi:MAG TPA: hypothetical protein VK699_01065 [Terriglobales bacterium]|jgi:hypothetical protein|nr:hypothetical protein [Terriglobales bacterium]